jgi:putative ABC transport system ATP-binding protein
MNKHLYEIKNIAFSYALGETKHQALKGISLDILEKSLTAFSGPSGSGKSTLLNLIGLMEPIQQGEILLEGQNLQTLSERDKNYLRKFKIGFIFQQFHLIPVLTAEENVSYFLKRQDLSKGEIQDRTAEALLSVGLWDHRTKSPNQMSGGQQQRVCIARALAKKPRVIIGDEPTANLDQQNGREVMNLFSNLVQDRGITIILTTHDPMVLSFATQNFHIQDGVLQATQEIL